MSGRGRMTLSEVVDKLTDKRQPSSTLNVKTVTTGPLAGTIAVDLTVASADEPDAVTAMVSHGVAEFKRAVTELTA